MMMRKCIFVFLIFIIISSAFSTRIRIALIRGGYVTSWEFAAEESVRRLEDLLDNYSDIDIVLFPEFAFAGIDGGTVDTRPQVWFEYDSIEGFIPHPLHPESLYDVRTSERINYLKYLAASNNIYIWASSCCERIEGYSYSFNSIPLISRDGKIFRIRRKIWYSTHDIARDTTVHLDTITTISGERVPVMTTICYENSALPDLLDPVDPPAPLWLLPHGTWLHGFEYTTAATQRWQYYDTLPEISSFSESHLWGIVSDGWVRDDAVMISCDIFSNSWGALAIDNVARDNVAWEPLAWVDVEDEYVVIDCDVPSVDELPAISHTPSSAPASMPKHLVAYPKISTGPIFIFGAKGKTVKVFDCNNKFVAQIPVENGEAIWDPSKMDKVPDAGKYNFSDGFSTTTAKLIR